MNQGKGAIDFSARRTFALPLVLSLPKAQEEGEVYADIFWRLLVRAEWLRANPGNE